MNVFEIKNDVENLVNIWTDFFRIFLACVFNPLPPSDAVWQQKKIFLWIFSVQFCLNLKNIKPLETFKFYNLGILNKLKIAYFSEKIPSDFS